MLVEPRRYLRCLGHPALFAPNGDPVRFRTRKHLALLIYLAVDTRPHQRARLAELLWPKVSLTEARHSLATALSTLRPRLGSGALDTGRDHVQLTPNWVTLDLDRLQAGDILGTEITGVLPVAAFLDGFEIADALEFTHWKDRQQARLLPMIKDALVVLIDRCRRTGDFREIERLADRMLALDELSEEAIRAKMEARAFAGDRLTALEFYEEWRVKLAEELHAVPSDLVEGIAVRLRRRGWERTTLTKIPTVPTDQWRGRPFIGRAAEYRILYEAWESVRRGEPGHALILGDSGVGKTTLVEKLITAAGLEGAAITRVQCYDVERDIPYSTVSNLIIGLLDRPGVSGTSPQALGELSRTVPAVRHRFPNIPPAGESRGESARIRLAEAFHELLATIAEEHPVILVVDDVHYADDVSLAALHLIMRRARAQRIMVLLVARPGELAQSPRATSLRTVAASLDICEIEVLPLGGQESLELLTSLLPTNEPHPTPAVQRALLRACAGYPMVLELLVQDWRDHGEQSLALSVDAMTEDLGIGKSPEAPYRKILQRITTSLDNATLSVMNLASVLGHRLNDLHMYEIVDLSAGQTMSGLAQLVTRRVLRDGSQGLEFVNEMVRASVYMGVLPSLRRVLHGKIADCFIEEESQSDDTFGLEVAWHCLRAGRGAEATPYLLKGAREAIRRGAPQAAERALATALPCLRGPERTEAIIILADALQEQSNWETSLGVLEELGSEDRSTADLAFVLRTRARRRLGYIDSSELAKMPSKLLRFMESEADPSSRIRSAVEVASIVNAGYDYCEVTPRLLRAVTALRQESLDPDERVQILLAQSMLLYGMNDLPSSFGCIREATILLEQRRTANSTLAMLHTGQGVILSKQGKYRASVSAYLECFRVASQIGSEAIALQASSNLALSFVRLGEYQRAIEWANRAQGYHDLEISPRCLLTAVRSSVFAHAMLGRDSQVEEQIQQGCARFGNGSSIEAQEWTLYAADGYAMLGRNERATELGWLATSGKNSDSFMNHYVGPYARWTARTSGSGLSTREAHEKLAKLLKNLSSFDAIDRAEVALAQVWLRHSEGENARVGVDEVLKIS